MRKSVILLTCLVMAVVAGDVARAEEPALTFGRFGTITIYREKPHPANVILFVSGDGGWNQGVVDMARELAGMDALVAGIDIVRYLKRWKKDQALMIGYSMGADVMPFAVNRLSKTVRDQVKGVSLLAPGKQTAFAFHLSSWMGGGGGATYPVQTERTTALTDLSVCQICRTDADSQSMIPLALVRPAVVNEIRKDHHELSVEGFICKDDLNRYRIRYVESLLSSEQGELTTLDQDVLESLKQHEFLTSNLNEEFVSKLTLGEFLADRIATFGGSCRFIILFGSVLVAWILINTIALAAKPFDSFPFILLGPGNK